MSWQEATYACAGGCQRVLRLGRLPVALEIAHGVDNFALPRCRQTLFRIEPEPSEVELDAYVEEVLQRRSNRR